MQDRAASSSLQLNSIGHFLLLDMPSKGNGLAVGPCTSQVTKGGSSAPAPTGNAEQHDSLDEILQAGCCLLCWLRWRLDLAVKVKVYLQGAVQRALACITKRVTGSLSRPKQRHAPGQKQVCKGLLHGS